MKTPTDIDQLDLILDTGLGLSDEARSIIRQFALEEFRRGYLHGLREMKMAAENVIASLKVPAT